MASSATRGGSHSSGSTSSGYAAADADGDADGLEADLTANGRLSVADLSAGAAAVAAVGAAVAQLPRKTTAVGKEAARNRPPELQFKPGHRLFVESVTKSDRSSGVATPVGLSASASSTATPSAAADDDLLSPITPSSHLVTPSRHAPREARSAQKLAALSAHARTLAHENEWQLERLDEIQQQELALAAELEATRVERDRLRADLKAANEALSDARDDTVATEQALVTAQLEGARVRREADRQRTKLDELSRQQQDVAQLEAELESARQQLAAALRRLTLKDEEVARSVADVAAAEDAAQRLREENAALTRSIAGMLDVACCVWMLHVACCMRRDVSCMLHRLKAA